MTDVHQGRRTLPHQHTSSAPQKRRAHAHAALLACVAGLLSCSPLIGAQPAEPAPAAAPPAEPVRNGNGNGSPRTDRLAPVAATPADGLRRPVTQLDIIYLRENENHPAPEAVLDAVVPLGRVAGGYVAPREGVPTVDVRLSDLPNLEEQWFFDSALARIAPAVVMRMQELGLIGIYVEPDPAQIAVVDDRVVDRRAPGDTSLRLNVTTGVVTDVRTVGASGDLPEDARVDNAAHRRIRARSPVGPADSEAPQTVTDLLRRDLIDDYVFRLNRHPGRRVDVAVAATGDDPGAVTLDYIVTENRPWFAYAQISNTGSESTDELRERFGFVHNQLTRNDDIFFIDYITANFDELHAVTASYERPFLESEFLRWRIFGSWSEYTAADVGFPDAEFRGKGWGAGAELIWNFFQHRDLFLDAVAGARWQNVRVENDLADITGETDFFLPYVGVRLERSREAERTSASIMVEFNAPGVAGTDSDELDSLGRFDTDRSWTAIQFDASHSFFIEPLLNPSLDREGALAHEFAFLGRGQVILGDDRVAPNFQDVAGGLYTVRGYPEAVAAGDNVFIASAEYRYHIARSITPEPQPTTLFGRPFRFAPQYQYGPTDWDLIFRTFIDFGRTVQNDRLPFEENHTLVGAGIGLELSLSRHFSARVDWGFALRDLDNGGSSDVDAGDNEIHFVVTFVF